MIIKEREMGDWRDGDHSSDRRRRADRIRPGRWLCTTWLRPVRSKWCRPLWCRVFWSSWNIWEAQRREARLFWRRVWAGGRWTNSPVAGEAEDRWAAEAAAAAAVCSHWNSICRWRRPTGSVEHWTGSSSYRPWRRPEYSFLFIISFVITLLGPFFRRNFKFLGRKIVKIALFNSKLSKFQVFR